MKSILLTLLRCLCLLLLLGAVVLYLDGPLTRLPEVLPDEAQSRLPELVMQREVLGIAGCILLLALLRALGCVWNGIFCIATYALLVELGLYHIGLSSLPSSLWPEAAAWGLADFSGSYPILHKGIPLLWLISGLCSTSPIRIALTGLFCYLLWLLASAGFIGLEQMWHASENPPFPELLAQLREIPWWTAALPGAFLLFYSFFMALFEAMIPKPSKRSAPPLQEESPHA